MRFNTASIALLALLSALSINVPTNAFDFGGNANLNASGNLNATGANLESMISTGLSAGKLSAAQAATFRAQLSQIGQVQAGYTADGRLSTSELSDLTSRFTTLTSQVNAAIAAGGTV